MDAIEKAIASVNQYLIEQSVPKYPILLRAKDFVSGILSVFGVIDESGASGEGKTGELVQSVVGEFVAVRDRIREIAAASNNAQLMALSDYLRDDVFVNLGIKVVDGTKGTDTWSLVNPDELRRELEVRREEKRAKDLSKLENKKSLVEREMSKWSRYVAGETEQETLFPEFSSFDAEGVPDDSELSASKKKAFKKEVEKFRKEKAEFDAKGGKAYFEKLAGDLAKLNEQINGVVLE